MNRPRKPAPTATPTPKAEPKRLPRTLISVLNGSYLTREAVLRNMPFILFLTGLMLLHISYGYGTERLVRQLDKAKRDVGDLRAACIVARERVEREERQSRVAQRIGELGLKESLVRPIHIPVPGDQLEQSPRP